MNCEGKAGAYEGGYEEFPWLTKLVYWCWYDMILKTNSHFASNMGKGESFTMGRSSKEFLVFTVTTLTKPSFPG